jgi:Flp pilus assembly protein TadB
MFATFANLGLLMLLMCLGCVTAGGVTLIIVLWSIDKEAQRDLRRLSAQLPQSI